MMIDSPFNEVPDAMLEEADEGDSELSEVEVNDEDCDDILVKLFGRKKKKVCN